MGGDSHAPNVAQGIGAYQARAGTEAGVAFAYGGAVGLAASFSSWQFFVAIVVVPSVAYQLMAGVIVIAVAMTPIGVWRLRRMDLVEKVKDLSQ